MWQSAGLTTPPPATIDQVNTYPTYNNAKFYNINGQENFPIMSPRDFFDKPKQVSQAFFPNQALMPSQATTSQAIYPTQAMASSHKRMDQGLFYKQVLEDAQQHMRDTRQKVMDDVKKEVQQQVQKEAQQRMLEIKSKQKTKYSSVYPTKPHRAKDQRGSARKSPDPRPRYSKNVQPKRLNDRRYTTRRPAVDVHYSKPRSPRPKVRSPTRTSVDDHHSKRPRSPSSKVRSPRSKRCQCSHSPAPSKKQRGPSLTPSPAKTTSSPSSFRRTRSVSKTTDRPGR